jgi:ATP-binding protein involved in chromosome partitioning
MVDQLVGVRHIVAVASGKGGVGKTTVTGHLALALTRRGRRVGVFDGDIYGPNVPLLLGLQPVTSVPIDLPIGRVERKPYLQPVERYGIKIMSMGLLLGPSDPVMLDSHFVALLSTQTLRDVIWGDLDYLLLDLPPGTGEPQQTLVQTFQIDGVIVVTTPQDLSLLDASRSLRLFQQAHVRIIGMIENMSYFICPHCGEQVDILERSERQWAVQDQLIPMLGQIPLHTALSRVIKPGAALHSSAFTIDETNVFDTIAAALDHTMRENQPGN